MKTYEALNLEIIRFEVRDIVTASIPVECKCVNSCSYNHNTKKWNHSGACNGGNGDCPASEHPKAGGQP